MHHITSRGNRRNNIFRDNEDYQVYVTILKEAIKFLDNQYEIIIYCLMTNHDYIQVEIKEKYIKYLMMRVNRFYAKYFNDKYNCVGYLFQARCASELIEEELLGAYKIQSAILKTKWDSIYIEHIGRMIIAAIGRVDRCKAKGNYTLLLRSGRGWVVKIGWHMVKMYLKLTELQKQHQRLHMDNLVNF